MRFHEERRRRTAELASLDPATHWHEIYRRLTLWELPAEARFGFQLAFYRPQAVPRMAAVLAETGHMRFDTTRRAYDTGLVIHEVIWGGPDSERGRRMVRLMNRLHDRPDILAEDLTYLLAALMVVPTRFMDRHGWRTVTAAERESTWRFWDALGRRMQISERPGAYADAEHLMAAYDATHLAPSAAGRTLTEATLGALRDRMPRALRPLTAPLTGALLDDPTLTAALGLPTPGPALHAAVGVLTRARRAVQRRRAPYAEPWFTPGQPAGDIYPHGYTLDDLDPNARQA